MLLKFSFTKIFRLFICVHGTPWTAITVLFMGKFLHLLYTWIWTVYIGMIDGSGISWFGFCSDVQCEL